MIKLRHQQKFLVYGSSKQSETSIVLLGIHYSDVVLKYKQSLEILIRVEQDVANEFS